METTVKNSEYLAPVAEVINVKCHGVLCTSQLQKYNSDNWNPFES